MQNHWQEAIDKLKSRRILSISTGAAAHGRLDVVDFCANDGSAIRIICRMTAIGPRWETGELEPVKVHSSDCAQRVILLDDRFPIGSAVFLIEKSYREKIFNSGILIRSLDSEILVLAGVYPHTFAVKVLGIEIAPFEPEYPISQYNAREV